MRDEFGLSNPVSLSQLRGKGNAPASGAISFSQLYGASNGPTFSPAPGSYSATDGGTGSAGFGIQASAAVTWTYSLTSGASTGVAWSISNGASATSISVTLTSAASSNRSATYTITANGQSWTIALTAAPNNSSCAYVMSYLPTRRMVGQSAVGDRLVLLNRHDDHGYHLEPITALRYATQPCWRIVTRSGISLIVSDSTPITSYGGLVVNVTEALGTDVPVLDRGEFRWEPIVEMDPVGNLPVGLLSCRNGTYAAGEYDDGRFIFTHNAKN